MMQAVSGWTYTPLEELFGFVIGGDWGKDPEYDDNLYSEALCIRGSEFRFWKSEKGKTAVLRKVKKSSLENRKLRLGDILIEISGGGPDQPVGRTVHIDQDVISFSTKPLICTNFLRLARPTNLVNSAFLNYFLTYFYKTGEIVNYQSGSNNLRNLQFKDYIQIPVPLPPQAEQTRIVEKLDEVLAQVDTIKARLDGIPAILKRFRQSVLAAAVSGRLTEEWRKTQNSDAIKEFSLIAADRVTVVSGKNKQVQPHLKSEEYPIPDSWFWVSLDALTRHIVDGTHHTPTYIESGIPFISVKDIKNGVIDFSDTKFISEEEHVELSKRCCVEKGDLLITKSGTIGRTAIVNTDREFSLFVSVALLKPASSLVNMRFVNVALQKWINEIDVSSRIVGSAIKNLHLRDMRVLAIPFAPLEEQKEIVRLVDQYFAFADTIAAQVKKAQTRVDNLTQSILAKAFRGELVAQDPSDEPAEKLLERIAQARKEAEALAKAANKVAKTK